MRPTCTIAALPRPTQIAAAIGVPPKPVAAKRLRLAIATPVKFEAMDFVNPPIPPPATKNDAQAINITHTGSNSTVAVRYVARAPRRPIPILIAVIFCMAYLIILLDGGTEDPIH